jgi:tryptophanyl-tRNA synthetase
MAVDILAAGLNPKKSTIFIQSHILEHANLAWILNTIAPVGRLQGMIEYKEKLSEGQMPNMGLLDYPVLQAADILLYKAEAAPIGEDQKQHLELTRDLAKTFNNRFGQTFKEPETILTKISRVMSLDNPNKKMSKSFPNGCLYLSDSPKIIRKKIKSAVTDSGREIVYDSKNKPAISNLLLIYSEFSGKPIKELEKRFKGINYSKFKAELAEAMIEFLKPIQENREKLIKNQKKVMKILEAGAAKARIAAQKTMEEVKRGIGLI